MPAADVESLCGLPRGFMSNEEAEIVPLPKLKARPSEPQFEKITAGQVVPSRGDNNPLVSQCPYCLLSPQQYGDLLREALPLAFFFSAMRNSLCLRSGRPKLANVSFFLGVSRISKMCSLYR